MTLNLLPLPYTQAVNIVRWCWDHNVDKDKCLRIIEAMGSQFPRLPDEEWTLEIPDKYVSWFVLKWGFVVTEGADEL